MQELGLYIHIPFCVRKCAYCDFLSFSSTEEMRQAYADALIREIRAAGGIAAPASPHEGGLAPARPNESGEAGALIRAGVTDASVTSIFIGGGTPSLMTARQLQSIMEAVRETFSVADDAEISMEMNPGTLNADNLSFVSNYVNRVSLGVQSMNDAELSALGRIHSREDAVMSVKLLREAGISNLNLDLMSAIPGQTAESWEETLYAALSLKPEHISAYSLIVEEGTPFQKLYDDGRLSLPDEETEREMYRVTERILAGSGYEHYEISNYALPGRRCRHNMRYWQRGNYLGFGLGAASLISGVHPDGSISSGGGIRKDSAAQSGESACFSGVRWNNTRSLSEYLDKSADPEAIRTDVEILTQKSAVEEFMFLGLRTSEGVSEEHFHKQFNLDMKELYGGILESQIRSGLLFMPEAGRYALTKRGIDVSNRVMAEFLFDE